MPLSDLHGRPGEHAQGRRSGDLSWRRHLNPALEDGSLAAHSTTPCMRRHRLVEESRRLHTIRRKRRQESIPSRAAVQQCTNMYHTLNKA